MNEKDRELIEQLSPEAQADVLHYARLLAYVYGAKPAKETPEQKAQKQAAAEKAAAEQARRDEEDRQALQKIRRYIQRTEIPTEINMRYGMSCDDMNALWRIDDSCRMMLIAFKFGMAKGYRAGMRTARARI